MMDIENITKAIENRIIKDIGETRFLDNHCRYSVSIPKGLVDKVYAAIDWDAVVAQSIGKIQDRICAVIAESMLSEIKTDSKKVLAIEGVRERLRAQAYPKIMDALNQETQTTEKG